MERNELGNRFKYILLVRIESLTRGRNMEQIQSGSKVDRSGPFLVTEPLRLSAWLLYLLTGTRWSVCNSAWGLKPKLRWDWTYNEKTTTYNQLKYTTLFITEGEHMVEFTACLSCIGFSMLKRTNIVLCRPKKLHILWRSWMSPRPISCRTPLHAASIFAKGASVRSRTFSLCWICNIKVLI